MRPEITERLLEVNRRFYQTFASDFSDSRRQPLPGVLRWVEQVPAERSVLDLGCGNGSLATALAQAGHRGRYLGLDQSQALADRAREAVDHPAAAFGFVDLASIDWSEQIGGRWAWIFCLATLHHLPGERLRQAWARRAAELLEPDGTIVVSVWNLHEEPEWQTRQIPWESIGVAAEAVDPGDVLIEWRRGGLGQRYVHLFQSDELGSLATQAGLEVVSETFAGGESGRLNRLQAWRMAV